METTDVIRVWKDKQFRETLTQEERDLIPANPAGLLPTLVLDVQGTASQGAAVMESEGTNLTAGCCDTWGNISWGCCDSTKNPHPILTGAERFRS